MPFLLLLIMTLACLPEQWPEPLAWMCITGSMELYAALTVGSSLALIALAASLAHQTRSLMLLNPDRREMIFHQQAVWRRRLFIATALLLLVQVYVLGWGWALQQLSLQISGMMFPGVELLVLAPFFMALLASWSFFYDTDRAMHLLAPQPEYGSLFRSRFTYVLFHFRQNLALIIGPILLLVTLKGLPRLAPSPQASWVVTASVCLLVLMFICLPWVLRFALGLRPLPAGPLRARLLATAHRLHFRFSNILLWDTHGCVANAMVAGIVPWVRYVLLTDRLINELTPDEVEAVFGHEIGHVKHRHMIFYSGFLGISVLVVSGLWSLATNLVFAGEPPPPAAVAAATLELTEPPSDPAPAVRKNDNSAYKDLEAVPLLTIAGAYIFVVFGFLSRRCERQADIYGCRAVSCMRTDCDGHDEHVVLAPNGSGLCPTGIRIFINALEKVADLNGISRSRPGWLQSWQHSTIARRVEFLQHVLADPSVEPRFQRMVSVVKWGLLLLLVAALLLLRNAGSIS